MLPKVNPTQTLAWKKLTALASDAKEFSIKEVFKNDSDRFDQFSLEINDLLLDYSKNIINTDILETLIALAEETQLIDGIKEMFDGHKINQTENRAVLHTALRIPEGQEFYIEGEEISQPIHEVLQKIKKFINGIADGSTCGYSGKKFSDIVNIGIGGSDLGPVMVTEALKPYWRDGMDVHFISNVDGSHLFQTLKGLDPETTLIIISSKSFTTQETMANASAAREWFLKSAEEKDIKANFVAVSTNRSGVRDFGIDPENMFVFWDWVGGRYSVSSAIGLSVACTIGFDNFQLFLEGLHQMDRHFYSQPFDKNIPVILGLLGIWYNNFLDCDTHAVLPYDQYLHRLPAYLQQLDMESNGKSVDRNGEPVDYETGPVIWGEPGTNGQHAFYQLIHQGTKIIPCDFIGVVNSQNPINEQHTLLLSNFLAQTQALMVGKTRKEVESESAQNEGADEEFINHFKEFSGNRPTNSVLLKRLTPYTLGLILSMYEHKVFVQGHIWNIFSFDQWGVQLGKQLSRKIIPQLNTQSIDQDQDGSTIGLLNKIFEWNE